MPEEEKQDLPASATDQDGGEKENTPQGRLKRAGLLLWRWALRLTAFVFVFFLVASLLLQIPAVQTWAARQTAAFLTYSLHTKVKVDYLYLGFFNRLVLEGFYVEDYHKDTLLYSERLYATFSVNPWHLLKRRITVRSVDLEKAELYIRRDTGELQDNLSYFLDQAFGKNEKGPNKKARPLDLQVYRLGLQEIALLKNDLVQGQKLNIRLSEGEIRFDKFDLPNKYIEAGRLSFYQPFVAIEELPRHPIPGILTDTLSPTENLPVDSSLIDTVDWKFLVGDLKLKDGRFSLHNYRNAPIKTTPSDELDFLHLDVYDIMVHLCDFGIYKGEFTGAVQNISARESSGFDLQQLTANYVRVNSNTSEIMGMKLITPYSTIGDTLIFNYREWGDFNDFNDRVIMEGHINTAQVAIRDIMSFAPGLKETPFIGRNRDRIALLDGEVRGRVNSLRGRDISLQLESGLSLAGSFSSRNLAVRNEEFVNLRLDRLLTSMRTLQDLLPNVKIPQNFEKLGKVDFQGSFDGFFVDFVAFGALKTDLGGARVDMRMNLKPGRDYAQYSGRLGLQRFDLGRWSDNPQLGHITLSSEVKNGVGLTANTASAVLTAKVDSFLFRGYSYENAILNGTLNKNLFDGTFLIKDDNIDFSFKGRLDFTDSIPKYDFYADIQRLPLKPLNLSNQDFVFKGLVDLNLRNRRLADLLGEAVVKNLEIRRKDEYYRLDSVHLFSSQRPDGEKSLRIFSEVLTADIQGTFQVDQLHKPFLWYFTKNYPEFSSRLGFNPEKQQPTADKFAFDIQIDDSKNLMQLLDPKLDTIRRASIAGMVNSISDSLELEVELPSLKYDNLRFNDVILIAESQGDQGNFDLAVNNTVIGDETSLAPIALLSLLNRDTVEFFVTYATHSFSIFDNLNLNGKVFLVGEKQYEINFSNSNLIIWKDLWNIDPGNFIRFGGGAIETDDFYLTSGERIITLESLGKRGLQLDLKRFGFKFIDDVWDYDLLDFDGAFNLTAEVQDIFKLTGLKVEVQSDTFLVNQDNWGKFNLSASAEDIKHQMLARMSIANGDAVLTADGHYNPPNAISQTGTAEPLKSNYFNAAVQIESFPLDIAEYFIGTAVSNTQGHFDADLNIFGEPSKVNIFGNGNLTGQTTIDYLGTTYWFTNGQVRIDNRLFDAGGAQLLDKYNNVAIVTGGITHDHLKNLGVNASLRAPRFLVLDTDKNDNPLYYGHAIADGYVRFNGSFENTDINVDATSLEGTHITIPVTGDASASKIDFIRFVNKENEKKEETGTVEAPSGLEVNLNLTLTDQAQMNLIFDEVAGDAIKGSGEGNVQIRLTRAGNLSMFGDYQISGGEYLFTWLNFVNKPFNIQRGGTIRWTGDPFQAEINIEAEYRGLTAPPANFIQEYLQALGDSDLSTQARSSTQVDLTMKLQGPLLKPVINFDISFPQLSGQLKNYTDNKLRLLKQDQNELNRQVFGLIVVGQFLPSDLNAGQTGEIPINTITEFLSNQLSVLLTELLSEVFTDVGFISGIDFDISYHRYSTGANAGDNSFVRGNELQLQLKQQFFNDRLSVRVGSSIDIDGTSYNASASGAFVAGDLVIEYTLTKDRRWRLRLYNRIEPDLAGQRRTRYGTGISYRREFHNWAEVKASMKKAARQ